jgi:hypothetical protein
LSHVSYRHNFSEIDCRRKSRYGYGDCFGNETDNETGDETDNETGDETGDETLDISLSEQSLPE